MTTLATRSVQASFGITTRDGQTYYAFKAFHQLVQAGNRVSVTGGDSGRWLACAGMSEDKKSAVILLAAYRDVPEIVNLSLRNLPWTKSQYTCLRLDHEHNLETLDVIKELGDKLSLPLAGPGVVLIKIVSTE